MPAIMDRSAACYGAVAGLTRGGGERNVGPALGDDQLVLGYGEVAAGTIAAAGKWYAGPSWALTGAAAAGAAGA